MVRDERQHSINGVPGRFMPIHEPQEIRGNRVYRNQTWTSEARPCPGYGTAGVMHVKIRFDDECKNGHMSFSITASVYTAESRRRSDIAAGGCMHEEIERIFPELRPLIKWHLTSTDGPMHYIANTIYHAGNRDCNGLTAGEVRQIRNGKTGLPCWILTTTPADLPEYVDSETCPPEQAITKYVPWTRTGEGKPRDFTAARSCAVWPEATDEQLCSDTLADMLAARLPQLIADFCRAMEQAGFLWL